MGTCTPEYHHIRDAEIRLFDQEPNTDDASDMYVIDVFGITILVRQTKNRETGAVRSRVVVESDHDAAWPIDVSINGDETTLGEKPDTALNE